MQTSLGMRILICSVATLTLFACGSSGDPDDRMESRESTVPMGTFVDDYDSRHVITEESWTQDSTYTYHFLGSDQHTIITRNDSMNPSEPGLFTRIDWIELGNNAPYTWAYCLTAYNAPSAENARNVAAADSSNPMTGCNGFPFTRMRSADSTH